MKKTLFRRLLAVAGFIGAAGAVYYYANEPLVRIRLKDGTVIRVLKVAYGTGANHEHELVRPSQFKQRLLQLLPKSWQDYFGAPATPPNLAGSVMMPKRIFWNRRSTQLFSFREPMISVWWVYDPPRTTGDPQQPIRKSLVTIESADIDFQQYRLASSEPDMLTFHRPAGPAKTFPVHLILNGESVTFTIPIPPQADQRPKNSSPSPSRTVRLRDASEESE